MWYFRSVCSVTYHLLFEVRGKKEGISELGKLDFMATLAWDSIHLFCAVLECIYHYVTEF